MKTVRSFHGGRTLFGAFVHGAGIHQPPQSETITVNAPDKGLSPMVRRHAARLSALGRAARFSRPCLERLAVFSRCRK
jgi:hypothetical protein